MIEETGRIVATEAGAVWVETIRHTACQSCSARKGCGHSLMDSQQAGARARVRAMCDDTSLACGDQVVVGIPEGALVRGAVMLYLMPLVLMFVAALLGATVSAEALPGGDLSAPFGVAGLVIGFLLNRWYSHTHASDPRLQPQVMRKVAPTPVVQTISLCHH